MSLVPSRFPTIRRVLIAFVFVIASTAASAAQVTPAAGYTPPNDAPSISVGATVFYDYTFQSSPDKTDANGATYSPNAFNVTRSYINFNGRISHVVNFRITPDIVRVADPGGSFDGAYGFRLKYAFAQINLDDWTTAGSWIRMGQQQTPWVDFEEGVYRYRFQGPVMMDRAGYLTSSDPGVSFHTTLPRNYGEVHVGVYNGEGYSKAEPNDQKAIQIRGTVRPFATAAPIARGLRLSAFADADRPASGGEKHRTLIQALFEHPHLSLGVDWAATSDRASEGLPTVKGEGLSVWVNPVLHEKGYGWEGLLRYDRVKPNTDVTAAREITIVGLSYWFPHTGGPHAALLLDYDRETFLGTAKQQKVAVHGLINY